MYIRSNIESVMENGVSLGLGSTLGRHFVYTYVKIFKTLNSVPNNKTLDQSISKDFAEDFAK